LREEEMCQSESRIRSMYAASHTHTHTHSAKMLVLM